MTEFSIKVEGFNAVEKNIEAFGNVTVEAVQILVSQAAVHLSGTAKRIVPVKTGRLQGSIQVQSDTKTKTGAIAVISPNTTYESYVEYGTSRMAARPYMRPAALDTENWIRGRLKGVVK